MNDVWSQDQMQIGATAVWGKQVYPLGEALRYE
jgi:hypothetical protein